MTVDAGDGPLYREAWPKERAPIRVGRTLVIVPWGMPWSEIMGARVVWLDDSLGGPATGAVFGTGAHETTRLALVFLEEWLREGDRVLDVGTGTGMLAIAAARLGARSVLATDIDPLAIAGAEINRRINGLDDRIEIRPGSLDGAGDGGYDLVLANILSPVIRHLAPEFHRLLVPGGRLIVAGIVTVEADDVRAAVCGHGFSAIEERHDGDWCAFVFAKA